MKLHLGCGEIYLEGYINIDYPMSEHTLQVKSVADKIADLTTLRYKKESIEEVRLHHTYEHFSRATALALLASWHSWLEQGGRLHIEVPDFDATAMRVLNPFTNEHNRKVGLRHIFGSNEAEWALHYEGWSKARLTEVFELFGFTVESTKKASWLGTYNISIIGVKSEKTPNRKELTRRATQYLSGFMVDQSDAEKKLLNVWLNDFNTQIGKTLAK